MTVLPLVRESWHHGITLAEIERQLRADQYSDDQIDMATSFVVTVREELAKRGKWAHGVPMNCPYCGARIEYLRTEGLTHLYRCPRHGVLMLPRDGRGSCDRDRQALSLEEIVEATDTQSPAPRRATRHRRLVARR